MPPKQGLEASQEADDSSNSGKNSRGSAVPQPVKVFVDGVQSIASHNGVHRVIFFNLIGDGRQNEPVLELMLPATATRAIGEALIKAAR